MMPMEPRTRLEIWRAYRRPKTLAHATNSAAVLEHSVVFCTQLVYVWRSNAVGCVLPVPLGFGIRSAVLAAGVAVIAFFNRIFVKVDAALNLAPMAYEAGLCISGLLRRILLL